MKEEPVPSVKVEFVNERAAQFYGNEPPKYATAGSAGFDIRYTGLEPVTLSTNSPLRFTSGIKVELPVGYELQIRSRSGLAAQGLVVTNSPGTIDSDYRGEIQILCHTLGRSFVVRPGDRIAQGIISPVIQLPMVLGEVNNDTERGSGGFGSTGV